MLLARYGLFVAKAQTVLVSSSVRSSFCLALLSVAEARGVRDRVLLRENNVDDGHLLKANARGVHDRELFSVDNVGDGLQIVAPLSLVAEEIVAPLSLVAKVFLNSNTRGIHDRELLSDDNVDDGHLLKANTRGIHDRELPAKVR